MPKLRVHAFSLSLDGYGAGPNQSVNDPLGEGGMRLHEWFLPTRTFQKVLGSGAPGETGIDDDFAARGFTGLGATIMGRNMFGPVRGQWPDESWTGWWGANPPFHHPVFVLTHHPREPVTMEGGTVFHFVTDKGQVPGTASFIAISAADRACWTATPGGPSWPLLPPPDQTALASGAHDGEKKPCGSAPPEPTRRPRTRRAPLW